MSILIILEENWPRYNGTALYCAYVSGFNDISWNNPDVESPNLQALAEAGVILDRNYVAPACSPWVEHNVMTWKRFLHYLPFCEGNPPVTGGFPHKEPVVRWPDVSFAVNLTSCWTNSQVVGDLGVETYLKWQAFWGRYLHIILEYKLVYFDSDFTVCSFEWNSRWDNIGWGDGLVPITRHYLNQLWPGSLTNTCVIGPHHNRSILYTGSFRV